MEIGIKKPKLKLFCTMDDLSRQVEEIEAISSIYENEWSVVDEFNRSYELRIGNKTPFALKFEVTLPTDYPSIHLPSFTISAPWLKPPDRKAVEAKIETIGKDNSGENVLFLWIECLREFVDDKVRDFEWLKANGKIDVKEKKVELSTAYEGSTIYHGDPITDRKSTFQGHVVKVTEALQVKTVLNELLTNRKIANATHNILAYRIYNEKTKTYLQDCNDDGETAAGGRMLHLLQILDVKNVLVVVSRWYGGIQLGPDRFKHINNSARSVLLEHGFIQNNDKKSKSHK
uniref:Protein IMPACT-like n=1 Tax=Phallusia mammillata TaxID=59560 RepID=A0A6F9DFV7_9ASCI|nr:protein IMPACT-like [Phallusia mammillata]